MKRALPTAAALVCLSASLAANAGCERFSFEFDAEPAFHAPAAIRLESDDGTARMSIVIGNRSKEELKPLGPAVQSFCLRLVRVMQMEPSAQPMGLDGIQVHGIFKVSGSPDAAFDTWSPSRDNDPKDFAVVDALFTLMESTAAPCIPKAYFEKLAGYFDFGIPVRQIDGPPLTLRIYGLLTIDHVQAFDQLIKSLPEDGPLVVDMSNFAGMGAVLYPSVSSLLSRKGDTRWVAPQGTEKYLQEIGIPINSIKWVTSEADFCKYVPQRFSRH